jgi:hypothetical protein
MKHLRWLLSFPYYLIWLLPLILLAPVYLTGRALFWGTPLLQFVPWWSFAWETLLSGHLPLWNPYLGMGAPLLANYQSALAYPPTWIYFALYVLGGVRLMAWGQALLVALHLAWSGLGMALLARRIGLGVLAQGVAGLSFGLCGYLVARAGFLSINAAAAWMPWVILSLTSLLEMCNQLKPLHWKTAILPQSLHLTLCVAMQLLSGHAQTTWYTLVLALLWTLYWVMLQIGREGWARRVGYGGVSAGLAIILGVGLAAVQLLPTAEYLAQSQRASSVAYDYAMNYSFWPWHFLNFLSPGMFGSPATGDYWGFGNYWEDAVYIGALPLLLAVRAVLDAFWRRKRTPPHPPSEGIIAKPGFILFLIVICVISAIFALGRFAAIYPWLYHNIPTFAMFQAPTRWMLWAEFALALLAAVGADRWRRPETRALYWTRLGVAGATAVLLGAGLGWLLLGDVRPTFVGAMALLGLWWLGAGLLSLVAPSMGSGLNNELGNGWSKGKEMRPAVSNRPYPLRLWQAGVLTWIAIDLLIAGYGLNPAGNLDLYNPSPTAGLVQQMSQGKRLYIPAQHENWLKYTRFLQFSTFHLNESWLNIRATHLPNMNLLDHIPMTNQFDPLTPGRYADWLAMLEEASSPVRDKLILLMNVGVIETRTRLTPYGVHFSPVEGGAFARWVACGQWAADGAEARRLILSGEVDLDREAVLEGEAERDISCSSAETRGATFHVLAMDSVNTRGNPNRFEVAFEAPASGWIIISEVWYPGWRAYLDGELVPILRANYLFRAIPTSGGVHRLVMIYQPISFRAGLAISLVSLAVMGVIWFIARRDSWKPR